MAFWGLKIKLCPPYHQAHLNIFTEPRALLTAFSIFVHFLGTFFALYIEAILRNLSIDSHIAPCNL